MTIIRSLGFGKNNLEHRIQTEASHLLGIFANTEGKFHRKIRVGALSEIQRIRGTEVSQHVFLQAVKIFFLLVGLLLAF